MNKAIRVAIVTAIALGAAAAPAAASIHDYAPGDAAWTGSSDASGLCVPALLCPTVTNRVESEAGAPGTGPGFIRTGIGSLLGVGATSTGTFTSAPFTYRGVGGKRATALRLLMSRRSDVGQLLAVAGNSATYSVDVVGVSPGAGQVQAIDTAPLTGADTWASIAPANLAPGALKRGATYRVAITTRYETGATVIPGGDADYDGVLVRARRATGHGNGNGGGGDTADGLAKSGVAGAAKLTKHRRIRVKVRCSRKLEGACKIGLAGLVTRHGPKLTAKRHVRVASGQVRLISLRVKKRFTSKLDGRRSIFARQTVRADKMTRRGVVKLRLRH